MKEDVGLSTLLELLTHGDAATSAKAKVTADCGGISRVRPFGQITLATTIDYIEGNKLDRQAQSIHKRYCNSGRRQINRLQNIGMNSQRILRTQTDNRRIILITRLGQFIVRWWTSNHRRQFTN